MEVEQDTKTDQAMFVNAPYRTAAPPARRSRAAATAVSAVSYEQPVVIPAGMVQWSPLNPFSQSIHTGANMMAPVAAAPVAAAPPSLVAAVSAGSDSVVMSRVEALEADVSRVHGQVSALDARMTKSDANRDEQHDAVMKQFALLAASPPGSKSGGDEYVAGKDGRDPRAGRLRDIVCYGCNKKGHILRMCPIGSHKRLDSSAEDRSWPWCLVTRSKDWMA